MPSQIEAELLEATELKPRKNEERQTFLHRLLDKAEDLDDDTWKGLSTETQTWMNEQATKIKADGEDAELDDFPDLEEDEEEASEDEPAEDEDSDDEAEEADEESDDDSEQEESDDSEQPEDEDEEESSEEDEEESTVEDADEKPAKKTTTKKTTTKKTTTKKAAAKSEKAPAKKAAAGPKSTGIKVKIKKMVFKKPAITVDELLESLSKDGTKPSKLTVSAIRSEFRHSLFVLRDLGALKNDVKL